MDLITERLTIAKFLADIGPENETFSAKLRAEFREHDDLEGIEFIRKGFELTESDLQLVPGERADIATISTIALDRDDEVLLPEGADLRFYRDNPIVPYAHDYYDLPIGTSEWVKIDSRITPTRLIAKTRYASAEANPKAQQVFLLIQEGILRAKSVGFIPLTYKTSSDPDWTEAVMAWRKRREVMLGRKSKEGDPRRIYTKWILLEQSPVPVPSNPEALGLAVSKGILTMDEAKAIGLVEDKPVVISKRDETDDAVESEKDVSEEAEPEEIITEATVSDDTEEAADTTDTETITATLEVTEPDYLRLHPDDRALIEDLQELLQKPEEGIETEEEAEEDPDDQELTEEEIRERVAAAFATPEEELEDDIELSDEDIKRLVAASLVEQEEEEPSPQIRTLLKQGKLI